MSDQVQDVPAARAGKVCLDDAGYKAMHAASVANPAAFWREHGQGIDWFTPYVEVKNTSFHPGNIFIRWFEDGITNAAYNCIDRHLEARGEQPAIIFEGEDSGAARIITYNELCSAVNTFANVLRNRNVEKGDRVIIDLPMIPEAAFAMLACARLGAIHAVMSGGLSPEALAARILDSGAKVIITADESLHGGRKLPLKASVDAAIERAPGAEIEHVVVVRRTGGKVNMIPGRDVYYDAAAEFVTDECPSAHMHAEDPLFLLYTSGSTGKPKGMVHATGGYLVDAFMTHRYVLDHRDGDVCWCTAEVGSPAGHAFLIYGPLANGATVVMSEGAANVSGISRVRDIIDRHKVTVFTTTPAALQTLMQSGDTPAGTASPATTTLRLLGSIGAPLDPQTRAWCVDTVGAGRCSIVETGWGIESGGVLITSLPGTADSKPGSIGRPFFGVAAQIVDGAGQVQEGASVGRLVIADSWPGQVRTIHGDQAGFEQCYFSAFPGKYVTGADCRRDDDGYYWPADRQET